MSKENLLALTADVSAAYLSNNPVPTSDVGEVVSSIYQAFAQADEPAQEEPEYVPAIDPRRSIKHNHIISLIDGQPYKMLKRHLSTHGLTPEQYRERYGLPPTYPMVSKAYAERRSQLAKEHGLGRGSHARGSSGEAKRATAH